MHKNIERMQSRLEFLYACGLQKDGSHTRMAFSPEDQKGRELFTSWCKEIGLKVRQDAAGNLIARLEGKCADLPAIIMGSHLDTVPDGGKFDGALGCVAGLEVCQALVEGGIQCEHPLEVIVFSDEEGFRFSAGMVGSSAFVGKEQGLNAKDLDFTEETREDVYRQAGIDFPKMLEAKRDPKTVHCCLELHVEQGGNLDQMGLAVGIVSSIAGVKRMQITIAGESNHAGSTRMDQRHDALVGAAKFIGKLPERVRALGNQYTVGTVGSIRVEPSAVNVIPGKCEFSLEIRDQNAKLMDKLAEALRIDLEQICREAGVSYCWQDQLSHEPMPMHESLKKLIQVEAEAHCIPFTQLPSGAFHDSLLLAEHFPTAMIFIASVAGKSHCKEEYSRPEDIGYGYKLLLDTVLAADKIKAFD
ncbi:MAG: Zn-dependent hydrolase [Eubacteriales bacterium]|nr:Zn-dependent hydrolase [Clostridiales bacterium]MDY5837009.1 Zn-dependent hydrolase [Eubacteriales bacterium]